ncbi:hypothetical protein D0812_07220 [Vibrio owensii]|uniref:Uncharacterized protein n=1 Tax=Vibrio owensii TaxID=696485 RepID=A0AAP9GB65_9VIBR|nr:hypothetical protein [Vibrio owensii]AYO14210.1 hypothetical protein D0812_07220 [Vibrio owensii]QGH46879.1 hypothetical protein APZ19_07185 [Vibrio owensii]
MNTTITQDDWKDYLFKLYFGKQEPLVACVERAYRDFNRTLHDFAKLENKEEVKESATNLIVASFKSIKTSKISCQSEFTEWHKNLCYQLKEVYEKGNYRDFHIGQAQKWINMTFKYIYTHGNTYLSGYDFLYKFCHVPIDNILLKELKPYSPPKLETAWSRINSYSTYMEFQDWFSKFDKLPLDVEFKVWRGEKI